MVCPMENYTRFHTVKDNYREVWYKGLKVLCTAKNRDFTKTLSDINETGIL